MIAGAGFAQMAWQLAQRRTFKTPWPPCERRHLLRIKHNNSPSGEYYRIIDKAAHGFRKRTYRLVLLPVTL